MPNLQLVPAAGTPPLEIGADQTMLGRDPHVDVVINDGSVSRRHAAIERRGATWVVVDQGSANGTWIDDARVIEAPLKNGQTLRLGAVSFSVVLPEEQPARAAGARGAADPRGAPRAYPVSAGAGTRNVPPRPGAAGHVPSPPAPSAPPPATGTRMTSEEAAALLGLWAGAPPEEVRRQYQRIYNDLQIRLTNAPAPSLKRMYQKNLQDLKVACEVLCPGLLQ